MKKFKLTVQNIFYPFAGIAALLLLWEFWGWIFNVPSYVLPRPTLITSEVVNESSVLLSGIIDTTVATLLSLLFAVVIGIVLGVIFNKSSLMRKSVFPVIIMLQSTPLVALIPIIALWLGTGLQSIIVVGILLSVFPVIVNSTTGFDRFSIELKQLFAVYGATPFQAFVKGQLPAAMQDILGGIKVAATLSLIGVIVAELIFVQGGMGRIIATASYRLDTPLLFGAVICTTILGVLLVGGASWLQSFISKILK